MSTSGVRAGGCSSLALVTHGEGPIGIQSFCVTCARWTLVRSRPAMKSDEFFAVRTEFVWPTIES